MKLMLSKYLISLTHSSSGLRSFILYIIVSLICFYPIVFTDKMIGHSIDWTVPDDSMLLKRYFDVNGFVWWDNFLGIDRSWYIYNFFYNYLSLLPAQLLNINGNILVKIYLILASTLSGYLFYNFSKNLLRRHFTMVTSDLVPFLAGLFYNLSAFKVNFMISGELFGFHFGMFLIPLFLNIFLNYVTFPSSRRMILVAITFTSLLISWVQFVLLIVPVLVALTVLRMQE